MELATFQFDVTPPRGHPLLGGLIPAVERVDDPLEAKGAVLLGEGLPIVLCAVDWCAISNEAHLAWRRALAQSAQTTIDRVLVHSVHQHNAPFVCLAAARIAAEHNLPPNIHQSFFDQCLDAGQRAVGRAIESSVRLTGIAFGSAEVHRVASNRRFVGADGKLSAWRGSKSKFSLRRTLPEGTIDPWLKTLAFFSGPTMVAALHFYATHPMSYYGDGRVTTDFVGLARRKRQRDNPRCIRICFTGCAGDVAAGRYNHGSRWARRKLTNRVYRAIRESEVDLRLEPIEEFDLRTSGLIPIPRNVPDPIELAERLCDSRVARNVRIFDAFTLAWRQRLLKGIPLPMTCLRCNDVAILSLPAECFIEYQLRAQAMRPAQFVAVAAYGDGGPWYIPTSEAYAQGGYEVDRALCDPEIDASLTAAMAELLGAPRNSQ